MKNTAPDGEGFPVFELFDNLFFRRAFDANKLAEWQLFHGDGRWLATDTWGGTETLDRIATLLIRLDPMNQVASPFPELMDAVEEAPQQANAYKLGDEFGLSGVLHMVVGMDEEGRYIVARTDQMLAVSVDDDKLTVTPITSMLQTEAS